VARFLAIGPRGALSWQPLSRCATFDTYGEAVSVAAHVNGIARTFTVTTQTDDARNAQAAALRHALRTVCRNRCPECGSPLNKLTSLREGVWVDSVLPNGAIRKSRLPGAGALVCSNCEHAEVLQ
jgi:hypothetical protein